MFWKTQIPVAIVFVVGMLTLVQWFIPHRPFDQLQVHMTQWFDIIAVFAVILGGLNLLKLQFSKIINRKKDWQYAIVTLVGFAVMFSYGFFRIGVPGEIVMGDHLQAENSHFRWMFFNIFTPLSATMFALLAFFVASASYRAFRIRNTEATLLLVAGMILMLGRVPLGALLTKNLPSFMQLQNIQEWIYLWPNVAGARAIMIGIGLGMVATSLRFILGIEKSFLGGDE